MSCLLRVDCLNCHLSDQRQDINYFYVSVLVAYNESKLRDAFLIRNLDVSFGKLLTLKKLGLKITYEICFKK